MVARGDCCSSRSAICVLTITPDAIESEAQRSQLIQFVSSRTVLAAPAPPRVETRCERRDNRAGPFRAVAHPWGTPDLAPKDWARVQ
eukprot:332151-Pyramimonas_sp.AAC.1